MQATLDGAYNSDLPRAAGSIVVTAGFRLDSGEPDGDGALKTLATGSFPRSGFELQPRDGASPLPDALPAVRVVLLPHR